MKKGRPACGQVAIVVYFGLCGCSHSPGVRRSPRKGEKRPIYALNLTIPPRNIDNCLEPAKTATLIDVWTA